MQTEQATTERMGVDVPLPKPAMLPRAVKGRGRRAGCEDLVADPTGDAVVFKNDELFTQEQMREYAREYALAAVAELVAAARDYLDHPHDAEGVNLAARGRLSAALAPFSEAGR